MEPLKPEQMCFGLDRELDIRSFACFLQLIGSSEFAETLAERIPSEEMDIFLSDFTGILKRHLSEEEYHHLFLQQKE